MQPTARPRHSELGLVYLLVGLAAAFGVASLTVGGPTLPSSLPRLPTLSDLDILVRSPSRGQLAGGLAMLTWAVWLVWAYVFITTTLRVLVILGERFSDRAAWLCSFRTLSDFVTVGPIRKAVDASLAGALFVRVAVGAGAQELAVMPTFAQVQVYDVHPQSHASVRRVEEPIQAVHAQLKAGDVLYTVQPNDSLGKIAERFYGVWTSYTEIQEANLDREQPDGRTLANTSSVIYPGWRLVIPQPTQAVNTDADGQRWYTVRPGDNLTRISARLLGDGQRYRELFELNQGTDMGGGRVLTNPNLIWPGLVLLLPPQETAQNAEAGSQPDAGQTPSDDAPAPTTEPATPEPTPAAPVLSASPTPRVLQSTPVAEPSSDATSGPLSTTIVQVGAEEQSARPTQVSVEMPSGAPQRGLSPGLGAVAGGGLAIAGLTGAAVLLRRRKASSGRQQADKGLELSAGFAEAEPAEDLVRRLAGDDLNPASVVAARFSRAVAAQLATENSTSANHVLVGDSSLAAVRHGRSSTTLVLQQVPMVVRAQLIGCLPAAATRAFGEGADVEGMITRDGDVLIRLTGITDRVSPVGYAVEGLEDDPEAWPAPSLLLRLGVLANGEVFAANWDALTHILVAAPLGQGADAVLGALAASLVAARSPAELGLIVLASPHALPEELLRMPHLIERPIDPQDEQAVLGAITLARKGLEQRIASGRAESPDLVLVMAELGRLSAEHVVALGPIMLHGPRYGVRVLAASARPAVELVQRCALVPEFRTRLVLRGRDEEESVALLGSGDATHLGPGGHLLVRLEGRLPLQATGYRVAADRLARLAGLIQDQQGSGAGIEPVGKGRIEADSEVGAAGHAPEREPQAEQDIEETEDDEDESESFEQAVEPPCRSPGFSGDDVQGHAEVGDPASDPPLATPTVEPSNGLRSTAAAGCAAEESTETDRSPRAVASILTTRRPLLRVLCLGTRALVYGDTLLWPTTETVDEACWELLVYLAVNDPAGVQGEVLADALLPEGSVDRSGLRKRRRKLRQLLGDLMPSLEGEPLPRDPQGGVYRLDRRVIESDVHRFLLLFDAARTLPSEDAVLAYEQALELYRGDLLDRTDVPFYRWFDEGARPIRDLRVKYAEMHRTIRRRLAVLLAAGPHEQLGRAEELYRSLVEEDPLDKGLWEALVNLHGRRGDLLGLESTVRRLRGTLAELGEEGMPATLERSVGEVRARLAASVV